MSAASRCARCGSSLSTGICGRCLFGPDDEPYALLEELGRGGMGTVWRARHHALDREVAIKFLADEHLDDPEMRARFLREGRLLAGVRHPGVVTVHDVGDDDGVPYLVMELVDGRPLSACEPTAPSEAVSLLLQACEAVAAIHALGLVHRDLKPDNLIVDAQGRIRVVDFGIARPMGPAASVTRTGLVAGTPGFVAPEALAGAPPDPRQDVYALGATLLAVMGAGPVSATELPEALRPVVARAMGDVERRHPSVEALADELARALPALDPAANLPDDERTWHRVAALLLTAATGVVLAAGLVSVTPKVLQPEEIRPLVMFALQPVGDGRMISWARFEEGPILAAVVAIAAGAACWTLLFRHWRREGRLEQRDGAVVQGRQLLAFGGLACAVGIGRRLAEPALGDWLLWVPLLGGMMEIAALWLFWSGVIEARRTGRRLGAQRALWAGLALALVPPVHGFLEFYRGWTP